MSPDHAETLRADAGRLERLLAKTRVLHSPDAIAEETLVIAAQRAGAEALVRVAVAERAYNTVASERAQSFEMLDKAVGGTGLTPYQPEIDLLIEARILSMRKQLAEALALVPLVRCRCGIISGAEEALEAPQPPLTSPRG